MPLMIGNRSDRVATLQGYVIIFTKDEEVHVPDHPDVVSACLARGHALKQGETIPSEESDDELSEGVGEPPRVMLRSRGARKKSAGPIEG